ncbi:MAG: PH domain-containing protein [Oscillospiraceae bacterium]|jgi:hypothetical protein|nr:PH domain-containing protein [Oscillospiraceae bacterium]
MAKIVVEDEEILWKDRKRHWGLPVSFTRYEVSGGRFVVRKGFFRTEVNELLLYRILDLKLVRSLGQKLFRVGTLTLYSADKTDNVLEVKNIKRPDTVRRFLSKQIERERAARGIAGRELYGAARGPDGLPDLDGDGLPG